MRRIALTVAILALTVAAGAQAPQTNRLPITRIAGQHSETNGSVIHLTGSAVVWFENGMRVVADEAFVTIGSSEIEFRGTVKITIAPK